MATISGPGFTAGPSDVVRRVTVKGSTEGVDQATVSLNKFADAQAKVATVSEQSARRTLSAEAAYRKQTLSLDEQARAQASIAKATKTADSALAQGLVTQDEHAKRIALINQHYGQMTRQQAAVGVALGDLNARLSAVTGAAGSFGSILTTLGPVGIGVAATIGAVVLSLKAMSDASHDLAQKAQELRRFSEVTGLTTTQVQALRSEASKFGVTSEEAQTAIQNFTARFNELRLGQGALLEQIRRVNPALADQMQRATDVGEAITMFGQALLKVDDIFQRNALVKAAAGRGGISTANFLSGLNVGAVTTAYGNKGLDKETIDRLAALEVEIAKTTSKIKENLSSIFARSILESEAQFLNNMRGISEVLKGLSVPESMKSFLTGLTTAIPVLGPLIAAMRLASTNFGAAAPAAAAGDTFSQRFSPANDNPLKPFTAQQGKTPEALAADAKRLKDAYGELATVEQIVAARQTELNVIQKNNPELTNAAKRALVDLARAQADGTLAMRAQADGIKIETETLGMSAGAAAAYRAEQEKITEALRTGRVVSDATREAWKQQAAAIGEVTQALEKARIAQQISFDRKTALLLPEDVQIAQQLKSIYPQVGEALRSPEAAALRAASAFNQLGRAGETAFTGLLGDIASGMNAMDALIARTSALGKSLTDIGSKSLFGSLASGLTGNGFNFDPVSLGIGAIGVGITAISGWLKGQKEAEDQLNKNKEAWAGMVKQMRDFVDASHGFDLAPIVTQLRALQDTAETLWMAATKANDAAAAAKVVSAWADSIVNAVTKFGRGDEGLSDASVKIRDLNQNAAQLTAELLRINPAFASLADEMKNGVARQIDAIKAQVSGGLVADINAAQGRSFVNDLNDLFTRFNQLKSEQSMTGVDTSLIDRWLEVQAQKVVDGAGLVGDSFNDMLSIFPNLTGRVHESTDALREQADAQKQLQDSINQTAGSVVDYINGLVSGPQSTLSPTATLANAQSVYNSNLLLAQGGNLDAQNKFVSLADNLEKAARAVYASSQGYQDIRSQIITQGLTLPAVTGTTDPVVQALRDAIVAIQVGATNTVGAVVTMQGTLSTAMNSGNPAAVALALSTYFNQLNTTADQGLTFDEMVAGVSPLARNQTVSSLLTQAQMQALGLASNTSVAGLLTAAQLVQGLGPISRDTTVGGLLTNQQLQNAGLAANTTVGSLLTAAQLTQAGLARDTSVAGLDTGNLLRIFQELDGNGNGILERSELVRAASRDAATSTSATAGNTSRAIDQNAASLAQEQYNANFLNGLENLTVRIVNAINGLGKIEAEIGSNHSTHLAAINAWTYFSASRSGTPAGGSGSVWSWLGFDKGGIAMPGQSIIYGEHHPQGPFYGRVGSEPIAITPSMPSFGGASNDNSALVSEMRELRKEVTRLQAIVAASGNQVAQTVAVVGGKQVEATDKGAAKTADAISMAKRDQRAA